MTIKVEAFPDFGTVMDDLQMNVKPGPTTILGLDADTLRGSDFSGMSLKNAMFSYAAPDGDLSGALFSDARLIAPVFRQVNLQNAIFSTGEWSLNWSEQIRQCHILDFLDWRNESVFDDRLRTLARALARRLPAV